MKNGKQESLSKFFTKILRHEPYEFGLTPNEKNFVDLEKFYEVATENWQGGFLTREEISYVLLNSKWQVFHRFDVWKGKVRATYKHTYLNQNNV